MGRAVKALGQSPEGADAMLEPRSRLSHTQDLDVLHGASVVLSPTDFASHWVLVLVQKEEEDELQGALLRGVRGRWLFSFPVGSFGGISLKLWFPKV